MKNIIKTIGEFNIVNGTISYMFYDEFTDPYDVREFVIRYLKIRELPKWLVDLSDVFIIPYKITEYWEKKFHDVFK